jgi:hypothetical protein
LGTTGGYGDKRQIVSKTSVSFRKAWYTKRTTAETAHKKVRKYVSRGTYSSISHETTLKTRKKEPNWCMGRENHGELPKKAGIHYPRHQLSPKMG